MSSRVWPEHVAMQAPRGDPVARIQEQLAAIGYSVSETGGMDAATKSALTAFQRRFRPACVDGFPDEETLMLLAALSRQFG